ncbi:hypothetical protein N9E38_01915 [Yoonia sp.]|nr:hypothetical protein [Yoonia sp.]
MFREVSDIVSKWGDKPIDICADELATGISRTRFKNEAGNVSKTSLPLSAASKIAWCRSPKNWTIFDSYAYDAIKPKSFPKFSYKRKIEDGSIKKMVRFYQRVGELGFGPFTSRVAQILDDIDKEELNGSRVFDKALYIMGSSTPYRWLRDVDCPKALDFGKRAWDDTADLGLFDHFEQKFGLWKQ